MLLRSFVAGLATAAVMWAPAAIANPAHTRSALDSAVQRQDWSGAVGLVDRLIDEQGVSQDLMDYRSQLQRLHTQSLLADIPPADVPYQVNASEAVLARESERERQLAAREARLAAREARQEQRERERLQRAEERYLRALERESLARTNAINARESRRTVCLNSVCDYRRVPVDRRFVLIDGRHVPRDRRHDYDLHRDRVDDHTRRPQAVYPGQVVRPSGRSGSGIRIQIGH